MTSTTIDLFTEMKSNPYITGLTDDEVNIITKFSHAYMIEKDEYIIREGDIEPSVILIKTGSVGLYKEKVEGEQLLRVLKGGDIIGDLAQIEGEKCATTSIKTR
ncbi:cyclic nucleotide-binding domain-containing protein [Alkalihalobacterium alkalinitrilicum]|uniref:cyclic nucleotide-binding domain-containing protein n=1 Tax=Alkalihalobacterium alkalinitrilicum TaxID=427920 RepID=UPI000995CCC0|nr:cyclic nucleotide-binding domain-containing protein [Alkalihalobacterium alkalinitrilicum]